MKKKTKNKKKSNKIISNFASTKQIDFVSIFNFVQIWLEVKQTKLTKITKNKTNKWI